MPREAPTASPHVLANREAWDRLADDYRQLTAGLDQPDELVWGYWAHPESELQILGEVAGKDVLDLGCGAGDTAVQLARLGARTVGLDGSARQLEHARQTASDAAVDLTLVQGDAEQLPFADASFDVVVSMFGALSFCGPQIAVAQVARVLRPGGLLAFCTSSPIFWLCTDDPLVEPSTALSRDYFDLASDSGPGGTVRFQLTYGGWIAVLHDHGLRVQALVEPEPPPNPPTPKQFDAQRWRAWVRRWPFDCIWVARKP